jgi:LmbE family N-acetylglucosaminyl deacetylase
MPATPAGSPAATAGDLVIVFSPHPDDDVIACGGTIVAASRAGARVVIVYATDGSMSHSAVLGIDSDPSPAELTQIRQDEARAAAKTMGVDDGDVHFLGFPDTRLADHLPGFARAVREILASHPEAAQVYLPHEVRELNADHRLTGETVLDCARDLGLTPLTRKFVVWDERTETEFGFVNRNPASHGPAPGERLLTVDIGAHLDRKRAALAEHRTQVTLFCDAQTRPVVPHEFQARVLTAGTEQFWAREPGAGGRA